MLPALAAFSVLVQADAPASRVDDYTSFNVNYQHPDGPGDCGHVLGPAAGMQVKDWSHFHANGSYLTTGAGDADTTILIRPCCWSPYGLTEDLSPCARAVCMTWETDIETGTDESGDSGDSSASSVSYSIGAGI